MDAAELIDWTSAESHVLLNPRMPREEQERLRSFVIDLPGHLWLATSGTTGALKLTALSKEAMLASAAAVNRHLQATAADVWHCVLPEFHVGGLGIFARAFLSGSRVMRSSWDAQGFASTEASLASLVPAQVRDLVSAGLRSPAQLRAIVVGGGALDPELYRSARELGWAVLPSYGMTETCSQVATAAPDSPELRILDHVETRTEEDGRLAFCGPSLLTGYATERGLLDPKTEDGWFVTEDLGEANAGILRIEGRRGDFVKIGGESVDLARLDAILASIAGVQAAVLAIPDARLGHVIQLVVERSVDSEAVAAAFNARVHPFERARAVHRVDVIPRSPLGKLLRGELAEAIPEVVE